MTRDELKSILREPYDRQRWTGAVGDWLPAVEWFARPQQLPDRPEGVENICQLGKVVLAGGRALALLEVRLGDGKDLLRNRIGLRKLIVKYIDQQVSHGVIAVFVSDDKEYRLTLAVRESIIGDDGEFAQRETAPRRYTFVLGPGEACTTAAGRLHALADKGKAATLADVVEAFSVERLNKEFFKRYREHYQQFVQYLVADDIPQRIFGIARSKDADVYERALKPVRDFAKKLLGRLVFLHFLQKKGWLGCPADTSEWTGGDPDFLLNLFKTAPKPERFYSERLVPLFFNALNRSNREGDLFEPAGTRVPYLNGGLFEEELQEARKLDFPATLFAGLLDFFGEYNFTIDENDPEDHEVGIDPEMLGHVFENLLEDNKDKGAYYTPKAIVQYMCQQSLIRYLRTHLGEHDEIDRLVRDKDRGEANAKHNWVQQNAGEIERLLDEVKICDPAIGSGAFPIGLLQEIYWIKLALDWTLDRAKTKRRIIQNSVYGVDIDAGAVEIARLRFWLALIVEEDSPSPLPNLDYKIMQGDSLLESFEGIPLNHLFTHAYAVRVFAGQGGFNFDTPGTQLTMVEEQRETLTKLMNRYFAETDPVAKHGLHKKIDALVLRHIDDSIREQTQRIELELAHHRDEIAAKKRKAKGWKPPAHTVKRLETLEKELKLCAERGEKLKALQGKQERPFFLWHVYFQDVFERGGFDIVIANPPYVRHETISDYRAQLVNYETAASRADLFVFFYERAVRLLRPSGVLTFISSNKFYRAAYGRKLRGYLAENLTFGELIDFGDAPVFEAIAYASILIAVKNKPNDEHSFLGYAWERSDPLERLREVIESRAAALEQVKLRSEGWQLGSNASLALLQKLVQTGTPLKEYVAGRFYYGIKTGLNAAFVIDEATRSLLISEDSRSEELIKPWLRGRDVKRWHTAWAGLHVIAFPVGFHEKLDEYPAIKRHLTKFKSKLQKRGQCTSSRNGKGEGQHHWLELDNNPKPAYLTAFAEPKLIIPAIERQCAFAYDTDGYYTNDKTSIIVSDDAPFLCAVLNSAPTWWIIQQTAAGKQNGYYEFKPMYVAPLPIPPASPEDKQALAELSYQATMAAGTELSVVEERINRIVYRLFALSETEILLIEANGSDNAPKPDAKSLLLSKVLPGLLEANTYVSFDQIVDRLDELEIDFEHDTLRSYLSEATATGVIHDAGRGWYSCLSQALELDAKPIAPLVRLVEKAFPLLDFSCWSTAQINPWTQHMLATHTVFLYAEADALPSLAGHLGERGWKVYVNPTPSEAESAFRPGDKTAVLRPALSKQPEGEDHAAPVEKVLVDLVAEASRLRLMDDAEAQRVVANAAQAGRIHVAALLAYARRRRVEIAYFSQSTNSTSPENVELMD